MASEPVLLPIPRRYSMVRHDLSPKSTHKHALRKWCSKRVQTNHSDATHDNMTQAYRFLPPRSCWYVVVSFFCDGCVLSSARAVHNPSPMWALRLRSSTETPGDFLWGRRYPNQGAHSFFCVFGSGVAGAVHPTITSRSRKASSLRQTRLEGSLTFTY